MKRHAIKMLPKGSFMAEEAMKIDNEGPPRWRNIPAWTPPIPGFDPEEYMVTEE